MRYRSTWTTRFGFYFAAVGSAFGLGNLWRFPYLVKENGGGAFVLLYLALTFFVSVPLLIGELMVGKTTEKSVLSAVRELLDRSGLKKWRGLWTWTARLAAITSLLVLSYYAVISGWVLHFFLQFASAFVRESPAGAGEALLILRESGGLQVALACVHILFAIVIVSRGLQNGLEKWLGYVMSLFAVLLVLLVFMALSLPTRPEALRFLLYPDFSKLTLSSFGQALGHVLFTLSVGLGIMVTFGSYLRRDTYIPEAGMRVAVFNTAIAMLAGLLIFPIALSVGSLEGGPDVLFEFLPRFFETVSGGRFFGVAFFLCLYLSCLGASIGLLEVIVSNLGDRWGVSRGKSCWLVGGTAFLVSMVPALSSSTLSGFSVAGQSILSMVDTVVINWALPIAALGFCFTLSFLLPKKSQEQEFLVSHHFEYGELFGNWRFIVRFVTPALIVLALLLDLVGLF